MWDESFLEHRILSLALAGNPIRSSGCMILIFVDLCYTRAQMCLFFRAGRNPIPLPGDYDTCFIMSKKCDCKSRGSSTRWNVKQPSRCSDGAPIADVLLRWSVHILTQLSALPLLFGLGVPLLTVLA